MPQEEGLHSYLDKLPGYVEAIQAVGETVIANIILIGQVPAPTFREKDRIQVFMDRLAEFQVDHCTTDGYRNPIGIVRGLDESKPPIFAVAHLDTFFPQDVDHHFRVRKNSITGPGLTDNSVGVGALVSLPEIFRRLNLRFRSDIVLAGVILSIGKGNLRGIRHLVKNWPTPIRGAVCIEGVELGRLSYYADGMIRCEVTCTIHDKPSLEQKFRPNAIIILNEVINRILTLRLPQRPRARVIIGKVAGGVKHGLIPYDATLGFEIQGDSDRMVKSIYNDVKDIVEGIGHEYQVQLNLKTISNLNAARLRYNHPLVKQTVAVMQRLDLKPMSGSSESELSIFLSRKVPAVTLGLTRGTNYHLPDSRVKIKPIYTGIAQIVGVLQAIDNGACDE
jgi:tripeptide aminopeptidase